MIPAVSAQSYAAARERAAVVDRSGRGRIVVSGSDRRTYLHGLLTNDIAGLEPGAGCYAAYLTAQGRMIADLYIYDLGDVLLLVVDRTVKDAVLAALDQFVFSEDVQLGDVTETFGQVAVVGPEAARIVASLAEGTSIDRLATLAEHASVRAQWRGQPAFVVRVGDTGEPGFDVFVERSAADGFRSAAIAAGAAELDDATAETLRIETGVPLFGRDMDAETIPLEAGIESRAISFTKGCYVGQEVIVRVLHRGHGRVVRKLVGLTCDGERVPAAGTTVRSGDRDIGHVTSSTFSPALQRPIALAYLHRDFLEPGTVVSVDGVAARVTAVPFVPPRPVLRTPSPPRSP